MLELKRNIHSETHVAGWTSNRTMLELKLQTDLTVLFGDTPSNRTMLELKLHGRNLAYFRTQLPIVPCWN